MKKLNELFQELGISKVRLAKYLGVSRQMVYNYLELDDISKWPKEKRILLCKLLDIGGIPDCCRKFPAEQRRSADITQSTLLFFCIHTVTFSKMPGNL